MDYANAQSVPMWNADQWLQFTETRHDAEFTSIGWLGTSGLLSFNLSAPANGDTLSVLLPLSFDGREFHSALVDGALATDTVFTVNGRQHVLIQVSAGDHTFYAGYGGPPYTPTPIHTATSTLPATPRHIPAPTVTTSRTPRIWVPFVASSP